MHKTKRIWVSEKRKKKLGWSTNLWEIAAKKKHNWWNLICKASDNNRQSASNLISKVKHQCYKAPWGLWLNPNKIAQMIKCLDSTVQYGSTVPYYKITLKNWRKTLLEYDIQRDQRHPQWKKTQNWISINVCIKEWKYLLSTLLQKWTWQLLPSNIWASYCIQL